MVPAGPPALPELRHRAQVRLDSVILKTIAENWLEIGGDIANGGGFFTTPLCSDLPALLLVNLIWYYAKLLKNYIFIFEDFFPCCMILQLYFRP